MHIISFLACIREILENLSRDGASASATAFLDRLYDDLSAHKLFNPHILKFPVYYRKMQHML